LGSFRYFFNNLLLLDVTFGLWDHDCRSVTSTQRDFYIHAPPWSEF
jgi:hypothetical protein